MLDGLVIFRDSRRMIWFLRIIENMIFIGSNMGKNMIHSEFFCLKDDEIQVKLIHV